MATERNELNDIRDAVARLQEELMLKNDIDIRDAVAILQEELMLKNDKAVLAAYTTIHATRLPEEIRLDFNVDSTDFYHRDKALCGETKNLGTSWPQQNLSTWVSFEKFHQSRERFPELEFKFCKDCIDHPDYALLVLGNL